MKAKTLLTVDWDAFIPEPIEADMSHQESLLYRTLLWQTSGRSWLQDIMVTSDHADPCKFWTNMEIPDESPHYVSDSHLVGYDICRDHDIRKVVLIDQHHDLWPWSTNNSSIHCGNWLTAACAVLGVEEIDWYVPAFSHCIPDEGPEAEALEQFCDEHGVTLRVFSMNEFWEHFHEPDVVHCCRSSCWTPPWLDKEFARFVAPLQPLTVCGPGHDGDWNPLDQRPIPGDDPVFDQFLAMNPGALEGRKKMVQRCLDWVRDCGEHKKSLPPEGAIVR